MDAGFEVLRAALRRVPHVAGRHPDLPERRLGLASDGQHVPRLQPFDQPSHDGREGLYFAGRRRADGERAARVVGVERDAAPGEEVGEVGPHHAPEDAGAVLGVRHVAAAGGPPRQREGVVDELGLDKVEWAASAAAPMPVDVTRFFAGLGLEIYDVYGMTETSAVVTANGPSGFRLGSVGRAIEGVEVRLGEDNEILVRGPVATPGYFKQEDATKALIDEEGWLHTGDIGQMDEDGFFYIVDRKKEMIITSAGKNIAPSNIENLLKESPLVGHAPRVGRNRRQTVTELEHGRSRVVGSKGCFREPQPRNGRSVTSVRCQSASSLVKCWPASSARASRSTAPNSISASGSLEVNFQAFSSRF